MSRLSELKKQYPNLETNLFDLFTILDTSKSYKYLPLLCKLFKERVSEMVIFDGHVERLEKYGINRENTPFEKLLFYSHFFDIIGLNKLDVIETFIDNVENKRVANSDVTSYQSIKDLMKANSLSEIRKIKKTLEKEIRIEFEDDIWMALRPLSFESSLKYGATTTWCTASKNNMEPFIRYSRLGVLVYFINKNNGYKFAGFKDLSNNDLGFWDVEDNRVDSMNLEIHDYMLLEIKKIFSSKVPNVDYCNEDMKSKLINYSEESNEEPSWDLIGDTQLFPRSTGYMTTTGFLPHNHNMQENTTTTLRILRNEEEN